MKDQFLKRKLNRPMKSLVITVGLVCAILNTYAQLNPLQTMYFQNKYLYNPAMAGLEKSMNLNIDYLQQWSSFPGTPKTESLTFDFQPTNKVGLGINVNNDEAGLIKSTRVMGTYAYHLPLNNQHEYLSFGVSLGVNDSRLNTSNVYGDLTDGEIAQFNQLKPYVDADFGIAYTNDNLYVGAALPNMKAAFFKSSDQRFDADRLLMIMVASYKIPLQNEDRTFELEPLAAYRIVKGYTDIVDVGVNFRMNDYGLYLQGIYHTSQSMGVGVGLDQRTYALNFSYNLVTGQLNNYTNGAFELGIKLRL